MAVLNFKTKYNSMEFAVIWTGIDLDLDLPHCPTSHHIWSYISKTTGLFSTIFGHKLGDIQGQIIFKDEVWIPTVSWENPFFVSESEQNGARIGFVYWWRHTRESARMFEISILFPRYFY